MSNKQKETVILLHGIGRDFGNMARVAHTLRRENFDPVNIAYPSLHHDIETLASLVEARREFRDAWERASKVHFVGHSLGGLIMRHILESRKNTLPREKMGRAVAMGSPFSGSEMADFLCGNPAYKWFLGPAGQQLTTAAQTQNTMQPWYELGIIAGKIEDLGIFSKLLMHGDHDGCVSVESTKLEGMKDHIVLPVFHASMGWNREVQRQVVRFLSDGRFDHSKKTPSPQPSPP